MSIAQNPASTRGKLDFSAEINMHGSPADATGAGENNDPAHSEHPFDARPNRVADAATLFARFCTGADYIVNSDMHNDDDINANDRTAVIAAQLLAIASQLERIGDALATLTGPGKTHTVAWFLERASLYGGEDQVQP